MVFDSHGFALLLLLTCFAFYHSDQVTYGVHFIQFLQLELDIKFLFNIPDEYHVSQGIPIVDITGGHIVGEGQVGFVESIAEYGC